MNPAESTNTRFEELVSSYLDASLAPEHEAELLVLLESPAHAAAFVEMTRLNAEIAGVLAAPVADETMEALVARQVGGDESPRTSARVYQNILNSLPEKRTWGVLPAGRDAGPAAPDGPAAPELESTATPLESTGQRSKLRVLTVPWLISMSLHAAAVILFVLTFKFGGETAPLPAPLNSPSVSESKGSVESIARVGALNGDAYTLEAASKTQVATGGDLAEGQGLETVGRGSTADVTFDDGTALILGADTRITQVSGGQPSASEGKRIVLDKGTLQASVAKQPAGKPMAIVTGNAQAVVLGTNFRLTTKSSGTRLEVSEGVVRFSRLSDGVYTDVKAGQYAVVEAGSQGELAARPLGARTERRFVRGVNLFGRAVSIEGDRWLSHGEARVDGLSIIATENGMGAHAAKIAPRPATDSETAEMLNTRAYSIQKDLALTQTLPNGDYDVFLWVAEGHESNYRLFDVQIGASVWRGVGRLTLGEWKKYGPFRTTVDGGKLEIVLKRIVGNPILCGFSVFSVPPGSPPDE